MSDDEARDRDLGASRGCVLVFLGWFGALGLVAVAAAVLEACGA